MISLSHLVRAVAITLSMAVIACGEVDTKSSTSTLSETKLPPSTRQLVGPAMPYVPIAVSSDIHNNMQSRRNHAWRVFERVNQDVKVADNWKVPVWQTWYDQEEFKRIFQKLFNELTPTQRQQQAPFSPARVAQVLQEWNKQPRMASFEPIAEDAVHQQRSDDGKAFDGVQVGRTLFSPEFVSHFLLHYKKVLSCTDQYIARFPANHTPSDSKNFSLCFDAEFPPAAVMIKAVFVRHDQNVSVFDSTSARMRRTYSNGSWQAVKSIPVTDITHQKAFSVYFSDKSFYRLAALHVATKEVREWIWATFWWSENPSTDFGADRDENITSMDLAFKNYKMCTVSNFTDGDRDPASRYRGRHDDLAAALSEATSRFSNRTWCANPYLEGTFPNTNCIACHQHGGTTRTFDNSQTRKRNNFPSDFTFAFPAFRGSIQAVIQGK